MPFSVLLANSGPEASSTAIGIVLVSLASILYFVKEAKEFFFPDRDREEQFLKRGDHDEYKKNAEAREAELRANINNLQNQISQYISRREFEELKTQIKSDFEKLDRYTHDNVHKILNLVGELKLDMVTQQNRITQEITNSGNKVNDRLDRFTEAMTKLASRAQRGNRSEERKEN